MAKPDARAPLSCRSIGQHLLFVLGCALVVLLLCSLLRLALLGYNAQQVGHTPGGMLAEAFLNGLRFDLRLAVYLCAPLLFAILSPRAMAWRLAMRIWLVLTCSLVLFLGLMEMDFYREFHQRLNGLVFQYVREDPQTVMSMLWYGFPVLRYLAAWLIGTLLLGWAFGRIDRATRRPSARATPWYLRVAVFGVCLVVAVAAARGTLRQGPPLRWGDAYTTESMFANQLGLNGTLSLANAAMNQLSEDRDNIWKATLPQAAATATLRQMLLTPRDRLVDADTAAVRRDYRPPADGTLPIRNLVVILMESFAGHFVGALGAPGDITPNFDRLAKQGLLFTRFFSNGTHTHQGMFASMACFPNLPGYEYLMQKPEGNHQFSGLPQLLGMRGYDNYYIYNGDFGWDNQMGFFGNQGMSRFIGRNDFVDPLFSDPTWGVSDQDMFDRAAKELAAHDPQKPFYALLQTLSNHTPYALPTPLPVAPVTGYGALDEHLTAMRYADWALGRFFDEAKKSPYYDQTLFVLVGDHGFGAERQLIELDLFRFNVPLLLIAPGLRERFGATRDTVGTQVDIVPTIMGRLGEPVRHQCWGRDLLALPAGDRGFGVIKPSGGEQTVALVDDDRILVKPRELPARIYRYRLGGDAQVERLQDVADAASLQRRLDAFLQTATQSLQQDTTGALQGQRSNALKGAPTAP